MFNYLSQILQNCNVIKLLDYIEDLNDYWLIFEKGGHNFSNLLFKIKGDFHNNERIYCIQKGIFLKFLFEDLNLFKDFFRKMLNFIKFLTINGIVHSDIKPDNNIQSEIFPPELTKEAQNKEVFTPPNHQ